MSNRNMSMAEKHHLRHLRDLHFKAQDGLCYFCDVAMTPADVPEPKPGTTVTIEHLKGRATGGGSNYLNTAASCLDCNTARSRQRQVGKRTVPRIAVKVKRFRTFLYTVPAEPFTLVLANSSLDQNEALLDFRNREQQPVTLKGVSETLDF